MLHEQLVVLCLPFAIDDQIGAFPVSAEQHGVIVDLFLGPVRPLLDRFEQGIRDAVSKADEFDVSVGVLPVGQKGEDQSQGRGLRVGAVVSQGDEADLVFESGARRHDGDLVGELSQPMPRLLRER